MSAYVRVSTIGQTTDNQVLEIESAGFKVEPRRIITETVSGPASLTDDQRRDVEQRLVDGASVSATAREFKTSRQTIMRVRDAMSPS